MSKDNKKLGENLRLLAKSSVIVMFGLFMSKLLIYIYRIIIAREFGPEAYGLFSLATMIAGWFIAVSGLGLFEGLSRYIPFYNGKNESNKIRYMLRVALAVTVVTGIISGIILFILAPSISLNLFHEPDLIIFLRIFSVFVVFSVLANPFLAILRGYEKIGLYSFSFNILQNLVKVVALILFIYLGFKDKSIIPISFLLGIIFMFFVSYYLCKTKLPTVFNKVLLSKDKKKEVIRGVFSYSIPLMFYGVLASIFYWVDTFSIGYYKGAIEVGLYNAAVPIAMLLGVVPEIFMQLFFPLINKEYSRGKIKVIKELSQQVGKWIFIVNLPLFILLFIFPGAALNILFGAEYIFAENALRLLSISAFVSSIFLISSNLISMMGRSKLVLFDMTVAVVINFLLNMILVPMNKIGYLDNSSGINGASLATLISVVIFNLLFVYQARKSLSIVPVRRKMFNIAVSGAIAGGILFYLSNIFTLNLIIIVELTALFILIYLMLIFLLRSFDYHDLDIINSIKRKIMLNL